MESVPRLRLRALPLGAALALALAACSSPSPSGRSTTTTSSPSSTTTAPSPPAGSAVPAGFLPGSVTFVSSTTGFVVGIDSSCPAGSCVALARTTDGGSTWRALPAPAAGYVARGAVQGSSSVPAVSEVRFADELDGWIWGPGLFATHDGGATWQAADVGGSVVDLEASGGYVDAVVSPCTGGQSCSGALRLEQAPARGGAFTTVASGPSGSASVGDALDLSLHAPVGFVDLGGTTGPSLEATSDLAAGAGGWKTFANPCASGGAGLTLVAFAAPDTSHLVSLCAGDAGAGSEVKEELETQGGHSTVAGSTPAGGDAESVAANGTGSVVVAAASGASWLYRSADGGATWTAAATYGDGGVGFADLGFTTATQGVAVHGLPGPPGGFASQLLITHDAGATWTVLSIA